MNTRQVLEQRFNAYYNSPSKVIRGLPSGFRTNTNAINAKEAFLNDLHFKLFQDTVNTRGSTYIKKKYANDPKFMNSQVNLFLSGIRKSIFASGGKLYRKNRSQNAQKHAWFVITVNIATGGVTFEEITIPGLATVPLPGSSTAWNTGWNTSSEYFPHSYMRTNRPNTNSVTRENISKFCDSTTFSSQNPWCRKKSEMKWTEVVSPLNNTITRIVKSGMSGIGVGQLTKLINSTDPRLKRRRYYLDIKRNGDYGEIFSCSYIVNSSVTQPGVYRAIMNPGSVQIANNYLRKPTLFDPQTGTPLNTQKLEQLRDLEQNGTFFYMNACFWTFDRPAAKLAQLMKIPFVFESEKVKRNLYGWLRNDLSDIVINSSQPTVTKSVIVDSRTIPIYTGPDVVNILNYNYTLDPTLPSRGNYPIWFQILSIIDTAHDFGKAGRTYSDPRKSRAFALKIRFLMVGLYASNPLSVPLPWNDTISMADLIQTIFEQIPNIEDAISDDINAFVTNAKQSGTSADGDRFSIGTINSMFNNRQSSLKMKLESINACIVYDSSKRRVSGNLVDRISLLSSKFADPN